MDLDLFYKCMSCGELFNMEYFMQDLMANFPFEFELVLSSTFQQMCCILLVYQCTI